MKRLASLAFPCITLPLLLAAVACSDDGANPVAGLGGGGTSASGEGAAGKGGAAGQSQAGGASAVVSGDDLLVDDFEDGDGVPLINGGWYGYTDLSNGGGSTLTFTGAIGTAVAMNGAGFESQRSLEVSYGFDQGTLSYAPFAGFGVSIGGAAQPKDLSSYGGISYTYQGGAHRARVETTEVTDYDVFGVDVPASSTWKTVILPFNGLAQQGWGKKVVFNPAHVATLSFGLTGSTGQTGKLLIDNLKVVKATPKGAPDMTINAASPPADGVIASIEITNPLQAKAMAYLTRGYNVTNWLEQARFSGFTYDEAFVAKLAQAGFKSLRLPIDLDLYVASKTGTGDSLAVTVDEDLFTILDAFDTWTKTHGLSLTIDYHQYSTLLNKADADSVATAVALWGKVAEHFAANTRDDLFFELLNEPELSFDGTDPTAAEWTAIAERMIAAIRASDQTHTVIFGDVEWYGIATLARRTPLSDANVIYAFHDYDPFIFTHQGAGWANMGSTHDLPYPYSPERWSQYYSDLGFNAMMDSWILGAVQTYYRDGSRAALRNHILDAKRWAVTNNVPVICNEFGAYDGSSRLEDRARYYADIVGIFQEFAIPWQHWFMVMNASGTVVPEYRTTMQLDG